MDRVRDTFATRLPPVLARWLRRWVASRPRAEHEVDRLADSPPARPSDICGPGRTVHAGGDLASGEDYFDAIDNEADDGDEATSAAPTTAVPTTSAASTTAAPTSAAPTTAAPTSAAPTTAGGHEPGFFDCRTKEYNDLMNFEGHQ